MKDEENREKAAADADKMATATAVYSKMADFIDFCSQSDDPSVQPPPATSKTLPRISKAVRPTRLPYGPLFSKAEIARLEELSHLGPTSLSKEEVAALESTYSVRP